MNEPDLGFEAALARWSFSGSEPAWDDVLERAGAPRRARSTRLAMRSRNGTRVAMTIAAALAATSAAAALAGLGVLPLGGGGHVLAAAMLRGPGSASGRFELSARGPLWVTRRGRIFMPAARERRRGKPTGRPRFELGWRLMVRGLAGQIREVRLISPGERRTIAVVCRPCRADRGRLVLDRAAATAAVNGARVVVRTRGAALRGSMRLSLRPR